MNKTLFTIVVIAGLIGVAYSACGSTCVSARGGTCSGSTCAGCTSPYAVGNEAGTNDGCINCPTNMCGGTNGGTCTLGVCTGTCSTGYNKATYGGVSGDACASCDTTCTANGGTCNSAGICINCKVGSYKAANLKYVTTSDYDGCVVYATAAATTDSPGSTFNVTPIAVYAATEFASPSAFAYASNTVIYSGGFDDQTYYAWSVILTGTTLALNRRTINGANYTLAKSSNGTADVAISSSITPSTYQTNCIGPGYLGLVYKTADNWGSATTGAWVASEIYFTYVATNGTALSTAKALTGNTNKNVLFDVQQCWYDNGIFFIAWIQHTHVQLVQASGTGPTGGSAATWTLNGLYLQGVNVTSGAIYYTNSTAGVQSIAMTTSNTGTCTTTPCGAATTDYQDAADPRGNGISFLFGKKNYTNTHDSTTSYLWTTATVPGTTPVYGTIKYGTITISTGAGSAGTTLATQVADASTFSAAATTTYVTTKYSAAGFLGSTGTYGVFIAKAVLTCTASTTAGCSAVYTVAGYLNGSSTATANVTVASGYGGSITYSPSTTSPTSATVSTGFSVQGFGTSDGYVLIERQESTTAASGTSPYYPNADLLQAETFFFNGSTKSAAASLGTFMDGTQYFQDTNGSILVGWNTRDYANAINTDSSATTYEYPNYSGMLGKYLAQQLTGVSLTSFIGLLSFMIVALFAF